jgi:hypothetical protein
MLTRWTWSLLLVPLACAASEPEDDGQQSTQSTDADETADGSGEGSGDATETGGAEDTGETESTGGSDDGGMAGTMVTFTVYIDETCNDLPPVNSTVTLDATLPCNPTPDASISELVCYADRITYMNHPNNPDCSSTGIPNELFVGACQQFPGPVATWKLIEADSYDCLTMP